MAIDQKRLQDILKKVQKPSQYLGNEVNAVHGDFDKAQVRVCLIFPDAYEMGVSHMGLKILYEILNQIPGVVAERAFAPLPDMEEQLRENELPWYSLESKTPLKDFDILGISLPYELTYTNILNILDLAQIPLLSSDRKHNHPLVLGGGTQSYNPEPMADFFDAVAIGDGEEVIVDIVSAVLGWKEKHEIDFIQNNQKSESRNDLLKELTAIEGLYIPRFFEPAYHSDGILLETKPLLPDYTDVKKRIVKNLDEQPYPTKLVVPNVRLIHDRIGIEIQRGCTRMCRFCQAGYIERPTRQRSPERVMEIADQSLNETGMEEISLLSLSAGDYQTLVPTLKELNQKYKNKRVSISVPATRTETLTPEVIEQIKQVRMTGFTIAPEAGSERMRRVISKGNKVEDLMQACDNAFSAGYRLIKFYYMCGLPFEKDDDVTNIAREAGQALDIGLRYTKATKINVSVSSFVPKPFTPFQWEPQMTLEETRRKHHLVKSNLKSRKLNFKCHEPEMSYLEGIFSRGDRRLSKLILQAFELGCRFDEWAEHIDFAKWEQAIELTGIDPTFYLHRRRHKDETLPWDHLFSQMKKSWLWNEYTAAASEAFVEDCSLEKCAQFCGVCDFREVKNKVYVIDEKPLAVKKGNREWYGRFGTTEAPESASIPQEPNEPVFKVRCQYKKVGLASLMGHLELMTSLKRALLRTDVPVAYSIGFHPQIKLSMGPALSLGIESDCEFFDLTLTRPVDVELLKDELAAHLPQGIDIVSMTAVDLRTPSITAQTQAIDYQIESIVSSQDPWLETMETNLHKLKQGQEFVFERRSTHPAKKPKQFRLSQGLCLDKTTIADGKLRLSIQCDPQQGQLKPFDVVEALSETPVAELNGLKVRKVGVDLCQTRSS